VYPTTLAGGAKGAASAGLAVASALAPDPGGVGAPALGVMVVAEPRWYWCISAAARSTAPRGAEDCGRSHAGFV